MSIEFPASPFLGQTHYVNNKYWVWDGAAWRVNNVVESQLPVLVRVDGQQASGTDTLSGTNQQPLSLLVEPTVKNYTESFVNVGIVPTAVTLDLTYGTFFNLLLPQSLSCTVTMPKAVAGKSFVLIARQYASGASITFNSVEWPNNIAPTLTTSAGALDIFSFFSDGTNWYGAATQGYSP